MDFVSAVTKRKRESEFDATGNQYTHTNRLNKKQRKLRVEVTAASILTRQEDRDVALSIINCFYNQYGEFQHRIEPLETKDYYTLYFSAISSLNLKILAEIVGAIENIKDIEIGVANSNNTFSSDDEALIVLSFSVFYCSSLSNRTNHDLPTFVFKKYNEYPPIDAAFCASLQSNMDKLTDNQTIAYQKLKNAMELFHNTNEFIPNIESNLMVDTSIGKPIYSILLYKFDSFTYSFLEHLSDSMAEQVSFSLKLSKEQQSENREYALKFSISVSGNELGDDFFRRIPKRIILSKDHLSLY